MADPTQPLLVVAPRLLHVRVTATPVPRFGPEVHQGRRRTDLVGQRRRRHRADQQPVETCGVSLQQRIGVLGLYEVVHGATRRAQRLPLDQRSEHVHQGDAFAVPARVKTRLCRDRPSKEPDSRHRVLHELSGNEAQQLIATAIEGLMRPAGSPQRSGHVDLRAAGSLPETSEPCTGVNDELPAARVVEPRNEPVVVPNDLAEAVRPVLCVEHRPTQQQADRPRTFSSEIGRQHIATHRRPTSAQNHCGCPQRPRPQQWHVTLPSTRS